MATGSSIRAGRAFVEIAADDSPLAKGLARATARMESWAKSLGAIARTMALPALGAALVGKQATATFADFEEEMAKVKARLDENDKGFSGLADVALRLGRETMYSAKQAAEGMTIFSEAGFNSQQIFEVMPATLNLAAAGMIEVAVAAEVARAAMVAFNLPATQVPHLMDMIAKGATESAADVESIGEAFKYAAPVAASAGVPIQDLVGALTLLHDAGINADMAGTTIRGALLALADPSVKATKLMKQYGIQVKDAKGNMLPMVQIIKSFEKSFKGMGSGDKLGVLGGIFDARQAAGVAKLIDMGSGKMSERIGTVYNSQGHAAKVAAIQMDTLSGSFKKFKGALETVAISAIGAVSDKLRGIVDFGRNVLLFLDAWIKRNKDAAAAALKWAAILIAIPPALMSMAIFLKLGAFALGMFKPLLNVVISSLVGFGKIAIAVLADLPHVFMMLLSPIGLVATAVGGLVAYFLYSSGVVQSAWAGVGQLFSDVGGDIMEMWDGIKDAISAGDAELAMEMPAKFFHLAWVRASGLVEKLWEDLKYFSASVWIQVTSDLSSYVLKAFYGIQTGWEHVTNAMIQAWHYMVGAISNIWQGASNFIAKGIVHVMGLLDPEMDKEAVMQELEAINQAEVNKIHEQYKTRADSQAKAHEERLKQLEEERQAALAESEKMRGERQGGLDEAHQKKIDDIQNEITMAKASLANARKRAAEQKEAADAAKAEGGDKVPESPGHGDFNPNSVADTKVGVTGTFSARAAQGIGGTNYDAQIAENTKRTADAVGDMAGNGGGEFA